MNDIVEQARVAALNTGEPTYHRLADEIERLRRLVEIAYGEGIVDVFSRGARIGPDNSTWETSDSKAALSDPEFHEMNWPRRPTPGTEGGE